MNARRPRKRKAQPSISPATGATWKIIPIDGAPIRRKARSDYDRVLRDIEKAKGETERFQTEDRPKFQQWLNANFGALLTEGRELQSRLHQAEFLVNEVQREYFFGGHRSIIQAYKAVIQSIEEIKEEERQQEENPEANAGRESGRSVDPDDAPELNEEEEEFLREFARTFGFDLDDDGHPVREEAGAQAPKGGRLKELYRQVVRRLHPDKGRELSPKEVEWWHEAQAAYAEGQVEHLELILTLCEIEEHGTKETRVSLLMELTARFKSSLRSLKRQVTEFRRDPAWNFTRRQDLPILFSVTKRDLEADNQSLRKHVVKYETMLADWKMQAERKTRTSTPRAPQPKQRRRSWQQAEFF